MNGCINKPKTGKERVSKTSDDTQTVDYQDNETGGEVKARDGKKKEEMKKKSGKLRTVEIPDDGVPYDTGWAWMIVLAGFCNMTVTAGYNRGTFLFFVNFLEEFQAPVTETALLFGVKAAVNSVVGLFVMNAVVGRFGVRRTVFVGGICMSLSAILGSFATDVTSLILFQAVFHGLGMSMLNMPTTVLLGFYFRRRRSLANSIMKCGVGMGAVAYPPIVTFLLHQYGLRGALLLMGAISLHTLLAALLLRPVSFYKKRKRLRDEECSRKLLSDASATADCTEGKYTKEVNGNLCKSGEDINKADLTDNKPSNCQNRETERSHCDDGCVVVIEQEVRTTSCFGEQMKLPPLTNHIQDVADLAKSSPTLNISTPDLLRRRVNSLPEDKTINRTVHRSSTSGSSDLLDAISQSNVVRCMSAPDLELDTPCVVTPDDHERNTSSSESGKPRTRLSRMGHLAKQIVGVLDFRLFHSPMFRLLVVFFICSTMSGSTTIYLPAMAAERGVGQDQSAVLLSIIGGLDFCCRLVCGFVADLRIVRVNTMIGVSFIILGVACQLTRLMTTFSLLIGYAVVQGLLGGVGACLMPILIMEDIGLENTAKAMGFMKLFMGGTMAAFHPLLGYIRDSTGSYDVAYNVIGAFTLLSAAIILCLPFVPHRMPPSRDLLESSPLSPNEPADNNTSPMKAS